MAEKVSVKTETVKTEQRTTYLRIKAKHVKMLDPDTAEIAVPCVYLTEGDRTFFKQMFPHTVELVYDLLNKEALLQALLD
jgi:hypothetical protein